MKKSKILGNVMTVASLLLLLKLTVLVGYVFIAKYYLAG